MTYRWLIFEPALTGERVAVGEELIALEGPERYEGLQRFLACVYQLTDERRLLRTLYLAEKP